VVNKDFQKRTFPRRSEGLGVLAPVTVLLPRYIRGTWSTEYQRRPRQYSTGIKCCEMNCERVNATVTRPDGRAFDVRKMKKKRVNYRCREIENGAKLNGARTDCDWQLALHRVNFSLNRIRKCGMSATRRWRNEANGWTGTCTAAACQARLSGQAHRRKNDVNGSTTAGAQDSFYSATDRPPPAAVRSLAQIITAWLLAVADGPRAA